MRPAIEVEIPNPNDSAQLNLAYIPLPGQPASLSIGVITGTGMQSLGQEYLPFTLMMNRGYPHHVLHPGTGNHHV